MSAKQTLTSLLLLTLFLLPPAWLQWQPEQGSALSHLALHFLWLAVLLPCFWLIRKKGG